MHARAEVAGSPLKGYGFGHSVAWLLASVHNCRPISSISTKSRKAMLTESLYFTAQNAPLYKNHAEGRISSARNIEKTPAKLYKLAE